MRYEIIIGSKSASVSLDPVPGSNGRKFSLSAHNKKYTVEILVQKETGTVVSIENRVFFLKVIRSSRSEVAFVANGRVIEASTKKKVVSRNGLSGITSVGDVVKSNFPAKIVKIMAAKGDRLNQGDTIMVVEAMKMEAQIKVPSMCVVAEIFVREGEMVERGKTLARLGPR